MCCTATSFFFFFNDTATTEIYTLSLHDALPISSIARSISSSVRSLLSALLKSPSCVLTRSEEHTSELQSHSDLVCRLLLEKKTNPSCHLPCSSRRKGRHPRFLPSSTEEGLMRHP